MVDKNKNMEFDFTSCSTGDKLEKLLKKVKPKCVVMNSNFPGCVLRHTQVGSKCRMWTALSKKDFCRLVFPKLTKTDKKKIGVYRNKLPLWVRLDKVNICKIK